MKLRKFVSCCVLLEMAFGAAGTAAADVWDTVKEAYTFFFPLVLMDATKTCGTNTEKATESKAPENQFLHAKTLATAEFRQVVTPNVDTLYSQLFLNLSDDAVVIHKPACDRFLSLEIMNAWSDCVTVLGTGGKDETAPQAEQTYLLTGPNFKGEVPEVLKQAKRVEMSTSIGWILGRTVCNGKDDLPNVYAIQANLTAKTLDAYLNNKEMPNGTYKKENDFEEYDKSPTKYTLAMSAEAFFTRVNELLVNNPGYAADDTKLAKFKEINVGAGLKFNKDILNDADGAKWKAMTDASSQSSVWSELLKSSQQYMKNIGVFMFFGDPIADFGTAYDYRAFIAKEGFGANPTYVAIYPNTAKDDNGDTLNAKNSYVLHFDKVPPVKDKGFWSVTAYNDDNFLIDNKLNRYCINDRSGATLNKDGTLDIYLQSDEPKDATKAKNWLPSGTAGFHIYMRVYLPESTMLDGTWPAPTVKKVSSSSGSSGSSGSSSCDGGFGGLALLALVPLFRKKQK